MRLLILFSGLFLCILPVGARHYYVLGGFKIGQKITDVKTGLASLKDSDIKGGVMRMFEDGRSGMVAFAHGSAKQEIVFLRGLTGFGLWELNALRAGQQ